MFEDLISELDMLGVDYEEDYDMGMLTIGITDMEKDVLVDVINLVNEAGLPFTIDANSLIVEGGFEEPMEDEEELEDPMAGMDMEGPMGM